MVYTLFDFECSTAATAAAHYAFDHGFRRSRALSSNWVEHTTNKQTHTHAHTNANLHTLSLTAPIFENMRSVTVHSKLRGHSTIGQERHTHTHNNTHTHTHTTTHTHTHHHHTHQHTYKHTQHTNTRVEHSCSHHISWIFFVCER